MPCGTTDTNQRKRRAAGLSVVSNSLLVIAKLLIGLAIGSVSVLSEAIHSGIDLLAAIIALFSVRLSGKPADADHPFGHGKVENISGTIEALLIFAAGAWILYEAVHKLFNPQPIGFVGWGVAVMIVSAAVNLVVSNMLFRVGRETDSIALQADAWHLRTDVYTSVGVAVSLAAIWVGGRFFPALNLSWLDPAAAAVVAVLILFTACRLTVQSARDLLDEKLPVQEESWINDMIAARQPAVRGFHRLRTRKAGSSRFVDFHIKVDPRMSVEDSHDITDRLSRDIQNRFPGTSVTIHIEPCRGECIHDCATGCFLDERERQEVTTKTGRKKPS